MWNVAEESAALKSEIDLGVHALECALSRLMCLEPTASLQLTAERIGRSADWLEGMLGLTNSLSSDSLKDVRSGVVCLANAYALRKLAKEDVPAFLKKARVMHPMEFCPQVTARLENAA